MINNSEEPKSEENGLTPEQTKKIEGFIKPIPRGSHTRCPLTLRMCDGKTCALWLDPLQSELKLISEMCLFRLAMKKIAGE